MTTSAKKIISSFLGKRWLPISAHNYIVFSIILSLLTLRNFNILVDLVSVCISAAQVFLLIANAELIAVTSTYFPLSATTI